MAASITALVIFAAIAFGMNRVWTLLVPLGVWPLYALGLHLGLWGTGLSDGWQYGLVLVLAAGVMSAAVGLTARRLFDHERGKRNQRNEPQRGW